MSSKDDLDAAAKLKVVRRGPDGEIKDKQEYGFGESVAEKVLSKILSKNQ